MRNRKRRVWTIGMGVAVALAALAWGAMRWTETGPDQIVATYLARYVELIPDELVEDELRQMAGLDGPGLLVLLAALDSPRTAVARSATVVLDQQLVTWREWPAQRASLQIGRLARGLARRVDQWSPHARSVARDLALQILDWPVDRRHVDRALILADCEYVLRSAQVSPRKVAAPAPQVIAPRHGPAAQFGAGDSPWPTTTDPNVTAAHRKEEPTRNEETGRDATESGAGESTSRARHEPRLLPDAESDRGMRQRIADDAGDETSAQPKATPASLDRIAAATTCRTDAAAEDTDGTSGEPLSANLPPELMLIRDLRSPGAAGVEAERLLRQSGFGDAELGWARALVSPDVTRRCQLLDTVTQMSRGSTQWLLWLSYDASAEVRGAAVARLVTSQAPHVARRLLELESTEIDPDIRKQLEAWRVAEATRGAAVMKSVTR